MKPIYPNVRTTLNEYAIKEEKFVSLFFESYLRKKYNGKYYLQTHRKAFSFPKNPENEFLERVALETGKFHAEIYYHQQCAVLDTKTKINEEFIFTLDEDQQPEHERISMIVNHGIKPEEL